MAKANQEKLMVIIGLKDQETMHFSTEGEDRAVDIWEGAQGEGKWAYIVDLATYFKLWPEQYFKSGKECEKLKKRFL